MTDTDLEPDAADEGDGELIPGTGTAASALGWGHLWYAAGIVPPYPGATLIPPVAPPPPARLDGADSLDEWVAFALTTYAHVAAWVEPRHAFAARRAAQVFPGTPARAKLEAACWALFNEECPPAMWCRFIVEGWYRHPPAGVDPRKRGCPWQVVYNAETIVERQGWFRRTSNTYGVVPAVLTPLHRALVLRHDAMTAALVRTRAQTPAELRGVVAEFFPGTTWETMLASAKAEAGRVQRDLNDRVKKGECLWR